MAYTAKMFSKSPTFPAEKARFHNGTRRFRRTISYLGKCTMRYSVWARKIWHSGP